MYNLAEEICDYLRGIAHHYKRTDQMVRIVQVNPTHRAGVRHVMALSFDASEVYSDVSVEQLCALGSGCVTLNDRHEIIGYVFAWNKTVGSEVQLNLISIAVHPDYRRQGIAEGMIQRWLSTADVWLHVRSRNAPAKALYAKLGFQPVITIPGFYNYTAVPDDGIQMVHRGA